jgi:SAM-dependent methyltransferase
MALLLEHKPRHRPLPVAHSALHRGNRLFPKRSSRLYWVLTQIREAMESAAAALSQFEDPIVIDFGCGNMPYRPLFEPGAAEYVGCDLPGNELADVIMEAPGQLPFADASADVVLSNQVLEHVESPRQYLLEARRVLKERGLLVLTTHGSWRFHPDPNDFRRWTSQGLRHEVESAGFHVDTFVGLLGPEATALQLLQDAVLHRVPHPLRPAFTFWMQTRITRADRRCGAAARDRDACVYVVNARPS